MVTPSLGACLSLLVLTEERRDRTLRMVESGALDLPVSLSKLGIGVACSAMAILAALDLHKRRRELPSPVLAWCTFAFLALCGASHLGEWAVLRTGAQPATVWLQVATAVVAFATLGAALLVSAQAAARPNARVLLEAWNAERSTSDQRIRNLEAEQDRLRIAVEASGAGLWEWDIDRDEIVWNSRMHELFDVPGTAAPQGLAAVAPLVHPADRERFLAEIEQAKSSGRSLSQTFRVLRRDGSLRNLMASSAVIRNPVGRALRMTGIMLDVTEPVLAQELFRNAVESAPCGMLLVDEAGAIVYANARAGTLFGWEPSELVGRSVEDLVPSARRERHVDLRRDFFRGPSRREMAAGRDLTALRRDGSEVPVEILLSPVQMPQGRAVISTIVDVSPRKEVEAERRRYAEELERRNRALDEFAYLVSHDLKAPLRAISMVSHWLHTDYGPVLGPEGVAHLTTLRERVAKMDALIQGALTYARAGREQGALEPVDCEAVLAEVLRMVEIPERFRVATSTPLPTVTYDRDHLAKILLNLVTNAIQHHDRPAGVVEVSAVESDAEWTFCVQDDGPGIDGKHHERVFRMFERLANARGDSSGVGLAIVRMLVERHGGRVTLASTPGAGCAFRFTIPKRAVGALTGSGRMS